jgi:hypothetical protein
MFADIWDDEAWPVSHVSSLLATLSTSPGAATWCSHLLFRRGDRITARAPDFAAFLAGAEDGEAFARRRAAQSIGRPLGDERFMAGLERFTKQRLRPGKRGPKPTEREPSPA